MTTVEEIRELLTKNKKRLNQELKQSKEAVRLIRKSTHSSLNDEEKEKIKVQLLDICKAIPAFADDRVSASQGLKCTNPTRNKTVQNREAF